MKCIEGCSSVDGLIKPLSRGGVWSSSSGNCVDQHPEQKSLLGHRKEKRPAWP